MGGDHGRVKVWPWSPGPVAGDLKPDCEVERATESLRNNQIGGAPRAATPRQRFSRQAYWLAETPPENEKVALSEAGIDKNLAHRLKPPGRNKPRRI